MWAMSFGFGIGSALFAIGALMAVEGLNAVLNSVVYAAGAVGFTAAAAVQVANSQDHLEGSRLRDPDWLAAIIQLMGTLFFNVMTIRALIQSINPQSGDYSQIWQPDVVGSILFLVASYIAWRPVVRHRRHHLLQGRSHMIAALNMLGSVFFGISAAGAQLLPTGEYANEGWNNWGTFLGAACFFVAAVALRPTTNECAAAVATARAS